MQYIVQGGEILGVAQIKGPERMEQYFHGPDGISRDRNRGRINDQIIFFVFSIPSSNMLPPSEPLVQTFLAVTLTAEKWCGRTNVCGSSASNRNVGSWDNNSAE